MPSVPEANGEHGRVVFNRTDAIGNVGWGAFNKTDLVNYPMILIDHSRLLDTEEQMARQVSLEIRDVVARACGNPVMSNSQSSNRLEILNRTNAIGNDKNGETNPVAISSSVICIDIDGEHTSISTIPILRSKTILSSDMETNGETNTYQDPWRRAESLIDRQHSNHVIGKDENGEKNLQQISSSVIPHQSKTIMLTQGPMERQISPGTCDDDSSIHCWNHGDKWGDNYLLGSVILTQEHMATQ